MYWMFTIPWGKNLATFAKLEMTWGNCRNWQLSCVVPSLICFQMHFTLPQTVSFSWTLWILWTRNSVGGNVFFWPKELRFSSNLICGVTKAACFHSSCSKVSLLSAISSMLTRTPLELQVPGMPRTVREQIGTNTSSDNTGSATVAVHFDGNDPSITHPHHPWPRRPVKPRGCSGRWVNYL